MKKSYYLTIFLYATVIIAAITYIILETFDLSIGHYVKDLWFLQRFIFSILFLILAVCIFLYLLWTVMDDLSKRQINQELRRILNNQPIKGQEESEISTNLRRLSKKMQGLTYQLQETQNAKLAGAQDIIVQERKRIARDLHDTVSQELFASSMILSGLSMTMEQLSTEQVKTQLLAAENLVQHAQNDLRVLLLHLRPSELENHTLSEGLDRILKELTDRSDLEVIYKRDIKSLPKAMEDHLFRIAQEFISNTLKHAKASRLEMYLFQKANDLELKMIDNGQGFDMDQVRELSYGLQNIQDRVDDMAGTMTLLSSPGKGVSIDIHLPLIHEEG